MEGNLLDVSMEQNYLAKSPGRSIIVIVMDLGRVGKVHDKTGFVRLAVNSHENTINFLKEKNLHLNLL